ncbi:MAG: MFS transporter [Pseudomonadales bacterium]|jgi:MFS family permease|nr:MFS transporter [Pseudomonadales bacterium]
MGPSAQDAKPSAAASAAPPGATQRDLTGYLGGAAFWLAGANLQQFLVTWILVGMLAEPGSRVGAAQLAIALPGFLLMLLGGGVGDRVDARRLLLRVHGLALLPPLAMAAAVSGGAPSYLLTIVFGVAVSALAGFSEPGRAALLSRVAVGDIQRTVVLSTVVSAVFGLGGTWLGGRIDLLGLDRVLLLQAALFGLGGLALARVHPALTARAPAPRPGAGEALASLRDGLRILWRTPLLRALIGLNFLSSVCNAGAWFVVYPFLVTRLFEGDAGRLALLTMLFFSGSIASNLVLLRVLPTARPGRLYLIMQLTRIAVLGLLVLAPSLWILALATFAWGMNMGVTNTMARALVQAEAPEAHRARVLSVFILGTMAAAPLGAVLLGTLVDLAGIRAGFVPALVASCVIFAIGILATPLWSHRDRSAP